MGAINLSVIDMDAVARALDVAERPAQKARQALRAGAEVLLPIIQANTPVRTGKMAAAVAITEKGDTVQVGVPHDQIHYAHLVERGHGGPKPAPAHPFLAPSLEQGREAAVQAIMAVLTSDMV